MNRMMVYSIVEKRFRRYSALTPDESAQARLYAETGQQWFREILDAMSDRVLWVLLILGYHEKMKLPIPRVVTSTCEQYYKKWLEGDRSTLASVGLIWCNTVNGVSDQEELVQAIDVAGAQYPLFLKLFAHTYGIGPKKSSSLISVPGIQECDICYQEKHALKFRECGHMACADCLLQILKRSGKCHMCRADILTNTQRPRQ